VEQVYFQKWWKQASAEQQRKFKSILAAKQIEFINGGWVMHDDAITTYSSMIDQTTMGHHFINDVFGADALPKSGWTVDPFGLSAVTAKV
jgi:alpha-mannosidase